MASSRLPVFDFDGIFIPDLEYDAYDDHKFVDVWSRLRPTFIPSYKIDIVTMRRDNEFIINFTIGWLNRYKFNYRDIYFVGGDTKVFDSVSSANKKADALMEINRSHGVLYFVESDIRQKNIISIKCKDLFPVYHIEEVISKGIEALEYPI